MNNIKELLKEQIKFTDGYLDKYLAEKDNPQNIIYKAMRYSVFAGGKRLRPILMMNTCKMCGGSPYTQTTPIAKRAVSYGGEVGFNLRAVCKDNRNVPVIYPFVRYEYYNPQEKGEGKHTMDLRNKVSMWTAGANWYALPNLVVKADYTTRKIGGGKYNSENEFSLAIAYISWLLSK